jgi:alpha-tubulin suppressor-like RCC1 family protein
VLSGHRRIMFKVLEQCVDEPMRVRCGCRVVLGLCGLAVLVVGGCNFDPSGRPMPGADAQVPTDADPVVCGNGEVDPAETCDGSDLDGWSCVTMGYVGGELRCTSQCVFDDTQCEIGGDCGNGQVDEGEVCDGSALGGFTCSSEAGHAEGDLACTGQCTFDISDCHTCGNGLVEGPEACDGAPGGLTCENQGRDGGQIACTACQADLSGCYLCGDGACDAHLGETHQECPLDCNWVAVDAGRAHTCAISRDGTVWCWGANASGQLGIGSQVSHDLPTLVTGPSGVLSAAAGDFHTCVALNDGTAWCWGANNRGQLGDGSINFSLVPVQVTGLTSVVAVAAGGEHSCALLSDQTLRCWGKNDKGQLGRPGADALDPVVVEEGDGLDLALSVTAGSKHTCAVKTDDTPWCWGDKGSGRLGDDANSDQDVPVAVDAGSGLEWVLGISAGEKHTCVVADNHAAWCWGEKDNGRLGDDWPADQPVPALVDTSTFLGTVQTIAAGAAHTCAVNTAGAAWCWGVGADGRLGNGFVGDQALPVEVISSGLSSALEITAGGKHTCGLKTDHSLWCWGANDDGQLGIGSDVSQSSPVPIL